MEYCCGECQAVDCKLWRPSHIMASEVELICWSCLEDRGYEIDYGLQGGSDQVYDSKIGHENWVPAVPDLDGRWWGYTSVPGWWCKWWRALPNDKGACQYCSDEDWPHDVTCFKCDGSGHRTERPLAKQSGDTQ